MTFEEIAEAQGWNVDSQLTVALSFVHSIDSVDGLNRHAKVVADRENGVFFQDASSETYKCDGGECGYKGDTYCSNCGYAAGER